MESVCLCRNIFEIIIPCPSVPRYYSKDFKESNPCFISLSLCLQDGLLDRLDDVEQEVAKNPDEQVNECPFTIPSSSMNERSTKLSLRKLGR